MCKSIVLWYCSVQYFVIWPMCRIFLTYLLSKLLYLTFLLQFWVRLKVQKKDIKTVKILQWVTFYCMLFGAIIKCCNICFSSPVQSAQTAIVIYPLHCVSIHTGELSIGIFATFCLYACAVIFHQILKDITWWGKIYWYILFSIWILISKNKSFIPRTGESYPKQNCIQTKTCYKEM